MAHLEPCEFVGWLGCVESENGGVPARDRMRQMWHGASGGSIRSAVLGACVGYPGAVTILEDRLGVWIRPIVQVLESKGICPSHRDLDSWAVLTHHLHAGLVDQPVVFPNRLDVARLDSLRLATLAAHDPQAILCSISKQAPFGSYQAKFRFIDLFAGIGGFRVALQAVGGSAVFSSEIESSARRTYAHNFGDVPLGDIRSTTRTKSRFRSAAHINELIPDFDVVAAGFPCQPFSLAGVSSRNHHGLNVGLSCSDQGTLFDDIMVIVRSKKRFGDGPNVLLLENVKNLYHHDSGRTFGIIKKGIEDSGYVAYTNVIDSLAVVPQRRKRLYFICIREDLDRKFGSYIFPDLSLPIPPLPLRSILERGGDLTEYQISSRLWASHRRRSRRHAERGNGFTVELADLEQPANTLLSRYYKDGKDCLISMGLGRNPRMLTPRECAKLQGFDPNIFILPPSRTAAYRAFGNAVTVPVAKRLAESIARYLK